MASEFTQKIVSQGLAHIRQCQGLISMRIRIRVPLQIDNSYENLLNRLKASQKQIEFYILQMRAKPPIFTCRPLTTGLMVFVEATRGTDDYQIMKSLQHSQQWVNQTLRDMNQMEIEEKQIRKNLIEFRDELQKFTEQIKSKISPSLHHKILDLLL